MPEEIEYKGLTIRIEPDDSPCNPRTEYDNVGTWSASTTATISATRTTASPSRTTIRGPSLKPAS